VLHTRGGWRDHTDGNRIVTTRGDKVEVVRGNYRMVVLGRHAQPTDAMGRAVDPGWDVSGGHLDEKSLIVSQQTSIRWTKRHTGTWRVVETTHKLDTESETTGDSKAESYGHHRTTTVGSETPSHGWHAPEDCPSDGCRINPKLVSRLWAEKIDSATGSSATPVPSIADTSFTRAMTSITDVKRMTEHTEVDELVSRTEVDDKLEESTSAGVITSTTCAGEIAEVTTSGVSASLLIGDSEETRRGNATSITLGLRTDVVAAVRSSYTMGGVIDVMIGKSADAVLGLRSSTAAGPALDILVGGELDEGRGRFYEVTLLAKTEMSSRIALRALGVDIG
jgi:hypothetical protein